MTDKTEITRELKLTGNRFKQVVLEEKDGVLVRDEKTSIIDRVFISKVSKSDGGSFYTITIYDKNGNRHEGYLNTPRSETDKELLKRLASLSEEEKQKLLEKL